MRYVTPSDPFRIDRKNGLTIQEKKGGEVNDNRSRLAELFRSA